ncbi:hypothetical protein Bbelb_081250 [Branchiostoma belcheri]|nr:hypothetical protein Bbelb_081250 [Branchiostoma belcheri]
MRKQARSVRNPLSGPHTGQTSGQPPPRSPAVPSRSPAVPPRNGASDMRLESPGTSSDTYEEAERVYHTIKDEDLPPSLRGARRQADVKPRGPSSQSRVSNQGGSSRRIRHGEGASDNLGEDQETTPHDCEETEAKKERSTGGASGHRGLCTSHRSCMAAGIAVMLSLVAVGLVPLTHMYFNKEASKHNQEDIRHLYTTVDAVKRDLDNERNETAMLKQLVYDLSLRNATGDQRGRLVLQEKGDQRGRLVLQEKGGPRGRLALKGKEDPRGQPALQEKADRWGRLVLQGRVYQWGRLVLQGRVYQWGRLVLQERVDPWGQLARLEKWDRWGRLALQEKWDRWGLFALQEKGGRWGWLALQENGEPCGRLALQEKGGPRVRLALQDNGDPRGRLALQDNGDPWGRLALQDNGDPRGRLALQDNGDPRGRLALQDNGDPRGRLALKDNEDSLGRPALYLHVKKEAWVCRVWQESQLAQRSLLFVLKYPDCASQIKKDIARVDGRDTTITATSMRDAKSPGTKLRQSVEIKVQT